MSKTYAQVLSIAANELKEIGIETPFNDSKKILAHIMGISKEELLKNYTGKTMQICCQY